MLKSLFSHVVSSTRVKIKEVEIISYLFFTFMIPLLLLLKFLFVFSLFCPQNRVHSLLRVLALVYVSCYFKFYFLEIFSACMHFYHITLNMGNGIRHTFTLSLVYFSLIILFSRIFFDQDIQDRLLLHKIKCLNKYLSLWFEIYSIYFQSFISCIICRFFVTLFIFNLFAKEKNLIVSLLSHSNSRLLCVYWVFSDNKFWKVYQYRKINLLISKQ